MYDARATLALTCLLSTATACSPPAAPEYTPDQDTDSGDSGDSGDGPDDEIEAWLDASLIEQVAAIEDGTISGAALLDAYLQRIAERDDGDGGINAIIALDPDATETASSLDDLVGSAAPLQGAVVMHERGWKRLSPEQQEAILKHAKEVGEELKNDIREHEARSLAAMKSRGLKVWPVDEKTKEEWRKAAESAYARIRGKLVPADIFDEVKRLLNEYQSQQSGNVQQ